MRALLQTALKYDLCQYRSEADEIHKRTGLFVKWLIRHSNDLLRLDLSKLLS